MERIERAAIWHRGQVWHVPQPGRHHDVIRMMSRAGYDAGAMVHQGFYTSHERFVDRKKARKIAEAAGQIKPRMGPDGVPFKSEHPELFSEDIW